MGSQAGSPHVLPVESPAANLRVLQVVNLRVVRVESQVSNLPVYQLFVLQHDLLQRQVVDLRDNLAIVRPQYQVLTQVVSHHVSPVQSRVRGQV